ncbi:hypothetical protein PPTG_09885 [Phytophthora nicotianae INRA-310]|uniref:HTH psq-type domain-containing protein n=1 Tax=Phytophthora nicotianae (strain INRA-310) TaxID=761204 RepID=W2QD93_PHYN3|nr:hypothetical protein PPTG_09885 [Phytophthora nicotianae INRA-310]ETN10816.1 hypothetical protein PPTG_09885 [Phytophthora nicotianae INRA-310]
MPRRDTRLTVKDKLRILLEAERGTVKGTARMHKVYPSQIRQWRKNRERLEETVKRNPRARAISVGRPLHAPALEDEVTVWILHRRGLDIAVSTRHVISKALSIEIQDSITI